MLESIYSGRAKIRQGIIFILLYFLLASALVLAQDDLGNDGYSVTSVEELPTGTSTTTPTSTPSEKPQKDSSGGGSGTPFLFFIALGLGIVFTNLWVVLGVRYFVRAHRRANRVRMNEIAMDDLNGRYISPRDAEILRIYRAAGARRVKLRNVLTREELNERFPVITYDKYNNQGRQNAGNGAIDGRDEHTEDEIVTQTTDEFSPFDDPSSPDSKSQSVEESYESTNEISSELPPPRPERHSNITTPGTTGTTGATGATGTGNIPSEDDGSRGDQTHQYELVLHHGDETTEREGETFFTRRVSNDSQDEHIFNVHHQANTFDVNQDEDTCAICIDSLEPDDEVRVLPCNHVFHSDCISPWLLTKQACCPLCKLDLYQGPRNGILVEPDSAVTRTANQNGYYARDLPAYSGVEDISRVDLEMQQVQQPRQQHRSQQQRQQQQAQPETPSRPGMLHRVTNWMRISR